MTQLYQATAKKTNILVGCINRSTVSEPPWRNPFVVLSETSVGQFVSIFGHWTTASVFGSVGGSPEESNKND